MLPKPKRAAPPQPAGRATVTKANPRMPVPYYEVTVKTVAVLLERHGATLVVWDADVGVLLVRDVMGDANLWGDGGAARPGDEVKLWLHADHLPTYGEAGWRGLPLFYFEVYDGRLAVLSRPKTLSPIIKSWMRDRRADVELEP